MQETPYWNPKTETMPREQLDGIKLYKLQKSCERAAAKSAFHRRRFEQEGFKPDQLKTLDDLRRVPVMTRAEWMECQAEQPLFGDLITATRNEAIRYHLTSGTSGRQPLRVLDGTKDWEWIAEMWCYGFWGFGVRPTDTVFFAFSYGSFIGFWGAHYCCEKIGSLVLPSGNMTTENRVRQIVEMEATTVCATPTYALRMAQVAREHGIDLPGSKVDKLIVSGEPAGSIPAVKQILEDQWGAKSGDTAGMTEIGTIMVFECSHQPGGTHIIEDHFIEEVLNPETLEPVPYGEQGERVVTSFGRGFIPLIRYRTGDLVKKIEHSHCNCGRTWDIYEGGILGRTDDMKLIRGTNVYPRAVEAIVREYDAIDEFQIVIWRKDNVQDEITVKVEIKPDADANADELLKTLGQDLARNHEGLRFNVERAEYESLPRFELKAKRLKDERTYGS
ncbi:MAG: phenylacetate--CoA ligase family protein [Planctomycetota bacterium]|nr:phenylacetate--CoA ligase family protein [Planctomycetota bacterium]